MNLQKIVLLKLRFVMAFIFLWAFFDKVFGLGFSTTSDKAWIHGGSPTSGFLSFATHGPLVDFFKSLSGSVAVDWLFMIGLLFVGLTLLFNKYVRFGAIAGIIMVVLMWLSLLPPENNPIIDEHIVYALVLALLAIKSENRELSIRS
jgi:thiosulfate dehydrogenase [quinone] large subunit